MDSFVMLRWALRKDVDLQLRMSTLLFAISAAAIVAAFIQLRMEFDPVAAVVHSTFLATVYYLTRARRYGTALIVLGIYVLSWTLTAKLGVSQLRLAHVAAGFERAMYPQSELLADQGISSFGQARAPCPCVVTVDVVAVSPLGAHGGIGGTDHFLWFFGWYIRYGSTVRVWFN